MEHENENTADMYTGLKRREFMVMMAGCTAGLMAPGLFPGEGKLFLSIEDNGVGFDPRGQHPGHMGLHTMRERIEELDGALEIESAPGQGTLVRATVPLRAR